MAYERTTLLHRSLTDEEERQFRAWARETHEPLADVNETWHPVVISECLAIDIEHLANAVEDILHPNRVAR